MARKAPSKAEIADSVLAIEMGNRPRYIQPNTLISTTTRTLHSRFLLRPFHELNTMIIGVLARAARRYRMKVCHFVVVSNQRHLILIPRNAS